MSSVVEFLDALEGTGTGAWAWDIGADAITWSYNTGPLFGKEAGFQPKSYRDFMMLVDDRDREHLEAAVSSAVTHGRNFEIDHRIAESAGQTRWLRARGHPVVDDTGKPIRLVGIVADVSEARRRQQQDMLLAAAGDLLSASQDTSSTLDKIARLVTEHLVDWCSVQILEDGELTTSVVSHRDPDMVLFARELAERYSTDPRPTGPAAVAIESGKSLLIEDITDQMLIEASIDTDHLDMLRSLGLHSLMIVPMVSRGVVLGLINLVSSDRRRRFTQQDLKFAEEFAQRSAAALDTAIHMVRAMQAREEAETTSRRLAVLQNLASRLATTTRVADVASIASRLMVEAAGADRGAVITRQGSSLAIAGSFGYSPEQLVHYSRLLDTPGPLLDAINTGAPVYSENLDELIRSYPNLRRSMERVPEGAFAAFPIDLDSGVVGAMGLVHGQSHKFSTDDRLLLEAFGRHTAVAMGRALLFEEKESVARSLHHALAPPAEICRPGILAVAGYEPAGVGDIGGDWYDVVDPGRGTFVYTVGDVVGRGLEAVAVMAQLRHSLRMLFLDGRKPTDSAAGARSRIRLESAGTLHHYGLCRNRPEQRSMRTDLGWSFAASYRFRKPSTDA